MSDLFNADHISLTAMVLGNISHSATLRGEFETQKRYRPSRFITSYRENTSNKNCDRGVDTGI